MIAIVHFIYSQSVHAPARDAGLMDNDAERYCNSKVPIATKLMDVLETHKLQKCENATINPC